MFSSCILCYCFILFFLRDYTAKAYLVVQKKLIEKAKEIGNSWTAENVGKVLWIVSIFSANNKNLNISDLSVKNNDKRKIDDEIQVNEEGSEEKMKKKRKTNNQVNK